MVGVDCVEFFFATKLFKDTLGIDVRIVFGVSFCDVAIQFRAGDFIGIAPPCGRCGLRYFLGVRQKVSSHFSLKGIKGSLHLWVIYNVLQFFG